MAMDRRKARVLTAMALLTRAGARVILIDRVRPGFTILTGTMRDGSHRRVVVDDREPGVVRLPEVVTETRLSRLLRALCRTVAIHL